MWPVQLHLLTQACPFSRVQLLSSFNDLNTCGVLQDGMAGKGW